MTVVPRTKTLHRRLPPDTLDSLAGQKWFSTIDQGKAYKQRFMYPDGQYLTGLVNPPGLYEWIRIQTGFKNAPEEFQRFMEDCLRDFRDDFCEPYLTTSLSIQSRSRSLSNMFDKFLDGCVKMV